MTEQNDLVLCMGLVDRTAASFVASATFARKKQKDSHVAYTLTAMSFDLKETPNPGQN
jgi:hypothetical protein